MTEGLSESVTRRPNVHWAIWALLGVVVKGGGWIGGIWLEGWGLGSFIIPADGGRFPADGFCCNQFWLDVEEDLASARELVE